METGVPTSWFQPTCRHQKFIKHYLTIR